MPRTSEDTAGAAARRDLRARTFHSMGTVISLTLPTDTPALSDAAVPVPAPVRSATTWAGPTKAEANTPEDELAAAAVERHFRELDQAFSLYRPDSEASSLARGSLSLRNASALMRERYEEALEWRLRTEGAFTPERPDGVLDLAGLIKACAIRQAGASLRALGREDWCLNAGGDILASGSPQPGSEEPWDVGIADPADRGALLASYPLGQGRHAALATSGSAERGEHIWGRPGEASAFSQVSVAAADITTADVLATAIIAGGMPMLDRAADGWDVSILAVRSDGQLLGTPGFRAPAAYSARRD